MNKLTNHLVMYFGISIAIGSFFSDFRDASHLIVSVTFSAVCFSVFDLLQQYKNTEKIQKLLLFIGIFSVIVVPYLSFLTSFLTKQNNFFTLVGLAIVIFLIGFRQNEQEDQNNKLIQERVKQQTELIRQQNETIQEQANLISVLSKQNGAKNTETKD